MNPTVVNNLFGTGNVSLGNPSQTVDQSSRRLAITDSSGSVKTTISVEVADKPETRSKGLGGRDSLGFDKGMLFVFDKPGKYTFWMKGMKFPLDFIWISDNRIVDLLPNINPPISGESSDKLPRYTSIVEFNKVLEVNAGFIASHNIQVGDKVGELEATP